ncbi:MAG: HlyD family efflux transporter periplasmic adaptor subunit [Desulfobulbaceae bacterium]|nr:HlyD family efflux transporter periplasmic adaptor subunit [Desulfobulbaceae bacterium]
MSQENNSQPNGKIIFRVVVCLAILLVGVIGMTALKKMKKPPAEVKVKEIPLRVKTLAMQGETAQVELSGFGQVTPLNKVSLSAEVAGRIISVHPQLDKGLVIKKNAILFRIDPSDYQAALSSAKAEVARLQKSILLLRKQMELDTQRLTTIERNRDLAQADFHRQKKLYLEHEVGSLADVEKLEQAYNSAFDQAAQMAKSIDLYPLQIEEAESGLAAAQARLENARTDLARCEVKAPFTGRVTEARVEAGQYVSKGQQAVVMADDSILEIPVSIDSAEAREWLRFKPGNSEGWFTDIEPVRCDIRWTDDDKSLWHGILHRVINFDPDTRTLTVAVRVIQNQTSTDKKSLPLVEGMFCSVTIPGRAMENVYRLPRWAVSFKNTVFLAVENRLQTVPVEVARIQDEEVFVAKGLKDGDLVITTRLVEPLENSLLEILHSGGQENKPGEKQ